MTRSHFIATTAAAILAATFTRKPGDSISESDAASNAEALANELQRRNVRFDLDIPIISWPTPLTDKDA